MESRRAGRDNGSTVGRTKPAWERVPLGPAESLLRTVCEVWPPRTTMASEGTGAFRSGKTNRRSVVRPNNTTASTATPMRIEPAGSVGSAGSTDPSEPADPSRRVTRGGMSSLVEPKGMVFRARRSVSPAAPGADLSPQRLRARCEPMTSASPAGTRHPTTDDVP